LHGFQEFNRAVLVKATGLASGFFMNRDRERLEDVDAATIQRLADQRGMLLRTHRIELAKDPTSAATKSSRSNLIAVQHTIEEVYGATTARDSANARAISTSFGKAVADMEIMTKGQDLSLTLYREQRTKEVRGKLDSAKMKNLLAGLCRAIEIELLENISPWALDNPHSRPR
jgi:hypothetical protein